MYKKNSLYYDQLTLNSYYIVVLVCYINSFRIIAIKQVTLNWIVFEIILF